MKKNSISVVSLFSGCGGLDLGFIQEGYNIIWANDNMKDACESYKNNIGKHIICKSILDISPNDVPVADLVIGGPPCQGFSGIGKRCPNDPRSQLVWAYLKIIEKIRPKMFLFENVKGLKSAKAPDGSKVISNLSIAFEKLGYHLNIYTLNAANYGVPQKRERVFIIGNRLGIDIPEPKKTHSETSLNLEKWVSAFEAISDLGLPTTNGLSEYVKDSDCEYQRYIRGQSRKVTLHFTPYSSKKDMEIIKCVRPGGNYMDVPDEISTKRIMYFKKTGGRTTTYGRLHPNNPNYTINTYFDRPNIGCNIHYEEDRMITIREGMRFQSFPDDFELVSSTKRNYYIQVGNAVPPLLAKAWANNIKKILTFKSISSIKKPKIGEN